MTTLDRLSAVGSFLIIVAILLFTGAMFVPTFNKVKMKTSRHGRLETVIIGKSLLTIEGEKVKVFTVNDEGEIQSFVSDFGSVYFYNLSNERISTTEVVSRTNIIFQFLMGPFEIKDESSPFVLIN